MSVLPLAVFGSIHMFELLVIGGAALLVFGPRLPEVALRVVAHVMRARRAVSRMWRETGLEDELRRVRRDIELSIPREADFDIRKPAKKAVASATRTESDRGPEHGQGAAADDDVDPDAYRAGDIHADEPYDSSVTIEPAEDIIASGEWEPGMEQVGDADVDRREPEGEPDADSDAVPEVDSPAEAPSGFPSGSTAGETADDAPVEAADVDDDTSKATD